MKKDFAIALVLVVAGVVVTAACSSSSKDKTPNADGGSGTGGVGGASGAGGSGAVGPDGGGRGGTSGASGASGATGAGGSAGDCSVDLEPCEVNGDCCGFAMGDNVCVDTGDPQLGTACLVTCTAGADCQSGCCAALAGGAGRVCGPASLCGDAGQCAGDLEMCEVNGDCCGFATGDNFCVDTGPPPGGIGVACLFACTTGTDCQSGCCAPLNGGMGSICAPAAQCQ